MTGETLPRRFGSYLLTALLREDALGRVYRAVRLSGARAFARVRILEGPEISEDAVLDAIQENGEIHSFLKNTAIARDVQLDSADGTPFLAWNEENGRTLDFLIAKAREQRDGVPFEHALLIVEKVATALDHAYNTTIDGERTLHGLVWPGFIAISDDGETRLTGFGLAAGFLPSIGRPRFAQEIAPYMAPEERAQARIGKNSDVYSVGAILFELLVGRLPNAADPVADLRTALRDGAPVTPEESALLKMCLGPPDSRFQSSGELRRELGKLLFSGPYSPSTFNLAFFVNGLFGAEIEAENRARSSEASFDASAVASATATSLPAAGRTPPPLASPSPAASLAPVRPAPVRTREKTPASGTPVPAPPPDAGHRAPFVVGGALLVAAAIAGTVFLLLRPPGSSPAAARANPIAALPAPTALPVAAMVVAPTSRMTEAQFKEEVARRVSQEIRKIDQEIRRTTPLAASVSDAATAIRAPASIAPVDSGPASVPVDPPAATPAPAREAPAEAAPALEKETVVVPPPAAIAVFPAEPETSAKISWIIKPIYPQIALRARLGGIVVLHVLVSETGRPVEIRVIKGVAGGLTESAVNAVRKWRFEPATRGGTPIPGWMMVPIPFEP